MVRHILKKTCCISPKIFKVCLTILEYYTLKGKGSRVFIYLFHSQTLSRSSHSKVFFQIGVTNPIPGRTGLFGTPPTSIRHNFFLVIVMKLKFLIASQLLIRKILPKHFKKICAIMELWRHFERVYAVFQLVYIRCDCNRVYCRQCFSYLIGVSVFQKLYIYFDDVSIINFAFMTS